MFHAGLSLKTSWLALPYNTNTMPTKRRRTKRPSTTHINTKDKCEVTAKDEGHRGRIKAKTSVEVPLVSKESRVKKSTALLYSIIIVIISIGCYFFQLEEVVMSLSTIFNPDVTVVENVQKEENDGRKYGSREREAMDDHDQETKLDGPQLELSIKDTLVLGKESYEGAFFIVSMLILSIMTP